MSGNTRNYAPLRETHQKVQELLNARDQQNRQPTSQREQQEPSPTRRAARDFGPLKETHQKVQELLASRGPQEQQPGRAPESETRGPTRPVDGPMQRPRGPEAGSMQSQQTYARDMMKFNAALRRRQSGGEGRGDDDFYKRNPELTRGLDGAAGPERQNDHDRVLQRSGPSR